MKLTIYLPELSAKSIRESAIQIHKSTKTLSTKQLTERLRKFGFYQWHLVKTEQDVYQTEDVFLTSDASYERARLPSQLTVMIFPNILVPLVRTDLECEINVIATVKVLGQTLQKTQYLIQIYKEEQKWKDEVVDIQSSAPGPGSLINPMNELTFLLNQLAEQIGEQELTD